MSGNTHVSGFSTKGSIMSKFKQGDRVLERIARDRAAAIRSTVEGEDDD